MSFQVYILYSEKHDKYYVGQTCDIKNRLARHNKGYEKYRCKYIPWQLKLCVEQPNRSSSLILEKKLKNLSKGRLEKFISKYAGH